MKRKLEELGVSVVDRRPGRTARTLHLVVKWPAQVRPDTIELHKEIADFEGAVWWGLATKAKGELKASEEWFDRLREQLEQGQPTYVFLKGSTSYWLTELVAVQYERPEAEEALIPDYYAEAGPSRIQLWLKLRNFEPTTRDELLRTLDPVHSEAQGKLVPLSNTANPLFVRLRTTPRVWWVSQGAGYTGAREGGYLWAPRKQKGGGTAFEHWQNMRLLREGDIVLNYADTQIEALSTVVEEAVESEHPDPEADQGGSESGWRAAIAYEDLEPPIGLGDIPVEWRKDEAAFDKAGGVKMTVSVAGGLKQAYLNPLSDRFVLRLAEKFPQLGQLAEALGAEPVVHDGQRPLSEEEPALPEIIAAIRAEGMTISDDVVRRYHLSLKTRGFVVLSGISGTGKTWLARAYADAVGAESLVIPVAPNWATNEDLLGYRNPLDDEYRDTPFSSFLRRAKAEHTTAEAEGRPPRAFHLILDEMNLAQVEYYFAKFLSAMELRAHAGSAWIELAPGDEVLLPASLRFIGTVNVDETTHGFADKVYDRAQLIELSISREDVLEHLGARPYAEIVAEIWTLLREVAPFAFRVLDEITRYIEQAELLGVDWEPALDEQLLQKVLPKIKGTDLRVGAALAEFTELSADRFPLSFEKARLMLAAFNEHGFTSYF